MEKLPSKMPKKLPPEATKLIKEVQKAQGTPEEADKLKKLRKELRVQTSICGAIKKSGKVCLREPWKVDGEIKNGRCASHGGKSEGATTEAGRLKVLSKLDPRARYVHGAYSKNLKNELTQEESEFYNQTMDYFFENYETDIVNIALLDRFAMNFIKQARKDSVDFLNDSVSYNDYEVKMIRFAESLGLNGKFKNSKENKDNEGGIAMLFMEKEKEN